MPTNGDRTHIILLLHRVRTHKLLLSSAILKLMDNCSKFGSFRGRDLFFLCDFFI